MNEEGPQWPIPEEKLSRLSPREREIVEETFRPRLPGELSIGEQIMSRLRQIITKRRGGSVESCQTGGPMVGQQTLKDAAGPEPDRFKK